MVGGVTGPLTEIDPVAERIRTAWRDLRRTGSTGPVRAFLYDPDPPLDVAQADALDLIVTHAPVRMSDVASLLRVEPSTATRTVAKLQQLDLVDRTADPGDARVVLVAPNDQSLPGMVVPVQAGERVTIDHGIAHCFRSKGAAPATVMEMGEMPYDPLDVSPFGGFPSS